MLAGGTDALYRSVLAAGHQHFVRIEVWSGLGVPLETLIPTDRQGVEEGGLVFTNGQVSASLNSRVTRSCRFNVPSDLYPTEVTDLLAPFGNEIRAYRGVRLGDGSEVYTWQVFRGRIRDVSKDSDGVCAVFCADRAADVTDAAFVSPQNSLTANTVLQEFQRLVQDALSDATFGVSDPVNVPVQQLTWELNRAAALDEMASSASSLWYALANGDFVMRRFPWTVASVPVVTFTDVSGGTVVGWSCARSRDQIFNVVTLTGERLNGDPPVFATVSDTFVGSPTNVAGGFGVRSLLERLQTPATPGAVVAAAQARLATSIAPVETWDLRVVPDAALELGDVVTVAVDGRTVTQVVSGLSMPLGVEGDMMVSTRSLVVNPLEVLS